MVSVAVLMTDLRFLPQTQAKHCVWQSRNTPVPAWCKNNADQRRGWRQIVRHFCSMRSSSGAAKLSVEAGLVNAVRPALAAVEAKSLDPLSRALLQTRLMRTKKRPAIEDLLRLMARLRAPNGCPWDREQDHRTLRFHGVEEVYELLDAIEAGDDHAMEEELGDLLLQVVFHAQMAKERGAFDFEKVARHITDKLLRRHPHVFGNATAHDAEAVLAQWDVIKHAEKKGTRHERPSALDGIPNHLPALLRAGKLVKKARKAKQYTKR
jgi:NTP pyrophosphatase (non-canonical NTP hydrolase)